MRKLNGNSGGALILLSGLFLFSIQDQIIKHFSGHYSILEIVFIRCLIASIVLFIVLKSISGAKSYIANRPLIMLLRGLLGFVSYLGYYMAIAAMPLAEVVSITFTMPLFVTALSAVVLREKVGIRRWTVVIIGFIGVLFIISPGSNFDALAVTFAFVASISYAAHTIVTRMLSPTNNPLTMSFNTLVIFTLASAVLSLLVVTTIVNIESSHSSLAFLGRDWVAPTATEWGYLVLIALIAAIGFFCLTKAYCMAEASAISPLEYSYILWAVLLGIVFWNEVPQPSTYVGIAILVGSNLYISYRERLSETSLQVDTNEKCKAYPEMTQSTRQMTRRLV